MACALKSSAAYRTYLLCCNECRNLDVRLYESMANHLFHVMASFVGQNGFQSDHPVIQVSDIITIFLAKTIVCVGS